MSKTITQPKTTRRKAKAGRTASAPKRTSAHGDAKVGGTARAGSKLEQIATVLRRPAGATIEQLVMATGWQAHSVRGAMSGSLKKKLGLAVVSVRSNGCRVYRIATA